MLRLLYSVLIKTRRNVPADCKRNALIAYRRDLEFTDLEGFYRDLTFVA